MGTMVSVYLKNGDVKRFYNVVNYNHFPKTKQFVISCKEYEDTPHTPLGVVHHCVNTDDVLIIRVQTEYAF